MVGRTKDGGHRACVAGILRTTYIALGEELHREFGRHEADELNRVSVVVIVARQAEVVEERVGQRVAEVTTVELKAEELGIQLAFSALSKGCLG